MNLIPAIQPTMYFIGVTTGSSSIMRVFPEWAAALGLKDTVIQGIDIAIHEKPEVYRNVVRFIKEDPLSVGALVTTHKIDCFRATRDLFDEIDGIVRVTVSGIGNCHRWFHSLGATAAFAVRVLGVDGDLIGPGHESQGEQGILHNVVWVRRHGLDRAAGKYGSIPASRAASAGSGGGPRARASSVCRDHPQPPGGYRNDLFPH